MFTAWPVYIAPENRPSPKEPFIFPTINFRVLCHSLSWGQCCFLLRWYLRIVCGMVAQDGAHTIASRESLNDSRQLGSKDQMQSHNWYQNLLDGTLLMWSGFLQIMLKSASVFSCGSIFVESPILRFGRLDSMNLRVQGEFPFRVSYIMCSTWLLTKTLGHFRCFGWGWVLPQKMGTRWQWYTTYIL